MAKIILLTGFSIGFVSILSFSVTWLLFSHRNDLKMDGIKLSETRFQYYEKDYINHRKTFGIVSFFGQLEDNFIYRNDYEHRKQILISPFGTREYECFGSCFCEDSSSSRKRSSLNLPLITGVSYLVASVSLLVAFDLAGNYFREKCGEEFYAQCDTIQSKVEDCFEIVDKSVVSGESFEGEMRKYYCYGNCLTRSNSNPVEYRPTTHIDCTKLKKEGEVVVLGSEVIAKTPHMDISTKMRETARKRFQQVYLKDFCKTASKIEYNLLNPIFYVTKSGEKREYNKGKKRIGYLCSSQNIAQKRSHVKNVNCRQIEPVPSASNNEWLEKVWWEKKKMWDES